MCVSKALKAIDPTVSTQNLTGSLAQDLGVPDELNLQNKQIAEGDRFENRVNEAGGDIEDFIDPDDPESVTPAARPIRALGIEPEDIELGSGDGDGEVKGKRSLLKKPTGGKSVAKAGLKV